MAGNSLPTLEDISPTRGASLDEKTAINHFLGKTLPEAELLFRENAIHYAEDLMWMGSNGFSFYLPALLIYLQSTHASGNSDALNSFLSLLEFKCKYEPESVVASHPSILQAINYCLEHYSKFQIRPEIYGDLKEKLINLNESVRRLNEVL